MDSSPAYGIILFIVFIFVNIMMYGFSSAVKKLNEADIQKKAEEGNKKAIKLYKIIDSPGRFVNTIQLTATCMSVILGFIQSVYFIERLDKILVNAIGSTL